MADLFFIHSDDPETIAHACSGVRAVLSKLIPEARIDQIDGPRWALLTGRNPFAPYALSRDPGGAAVVIGSTFNPGGPLISDLGKPAPADRIQAMKEYSRHLNFGMAVSVHDGEVLAVSDWLGLYPVYYFQTDSLLILTSIPSLLLRVKGVQPGPDIHGLASLLLLAHTSLGHTLYRGVSRLPSMSLLRYDAANRKVSLEGVSWQAGFPAPANLDEAVDAFDAALGSMVTEAARELAPSIYLSGGLDSRIIAGYLGRFAGGARTAVTMGDRRDLEMKAAARVASAIGAAHEMIPIDQSAYPLYVQRSLDHDAMTSGLYVLAEWAVSEQLRRPMLTGFLGDPVMGASHADWGREPSCDLHTFHSLFMNANASGLSPGIIRELVRAENIDDVVCDVLRRLQDEYDSYSDDPRRRTWWFDLLHRQRFLIGRLLKILARRSWPVVPFAHSSVIRLAAATPLEVLSDRKVQVKLLQRNFPDLARLPLARDIDLVLYRLDQRLASPWRRAIERAKASLSWRLRRRFELPERRVFMRSFDFNGPGWMILRDQARARSGRADFLLNKDLVLKLIPPSSLETRFQRAISEPTARKALIGAVLQVSQSAERNACG